MKTLLAWLTIQSLAYAVSSGGAEALKKYLTTSTAKVLYNPADESDAIARVQMVRKYTYVVREDRPAKLRAEVRYTVIGTKLWDERTRTFKERPFARAQNVVRTYRLTRKNGTWIVEPPGFPEYFVLKR